MPLDRASTNRFNRCFFRLFGVSSLLAIPGLSNGGGDPGKVVQAFGLGASSGEWRSEGRYPELTSPKGRAL